MLPVLKVPPPITAALAVLASLVVLASPPAALLLVALVVMGLAIVDGRPRTAVALVAGLALSVGLALLQIELATRELPPGTRSHAGLAFLVLPWILLIAAISTAVAFTTVHRVRRRAKPGLSPAVDIDVGDSTR